jgi:ribonuclease HI
MFEFAIPIQPTVTNNQAEYEALLRGLLYLREAGAVSVEVYGDSELVIKQLNGQYECKSEALRSYYEECREILKSFPLVTLQHIPREHNVGDSPRGPLKQRGNPHLKPATKPKHAKPNHAGT